MRILTEIIFFKVREEIGRIRLSGDSAFRNLRLLGPTVPTAASAPRGVQPVALKVDLEASSSSISRSPGHIA